MEKIYMEDNNNNKKSDTNRFSKGNGIVTASVLIAIVAVFAFVATSFSSPSWAAVPSIENKLGDTFKMVYQKGKLTVKSSSKTNPNPPQSYVNKYFADKDDGISIFCIEENKDTIDDAEYKLTDDVVDYGMLYILANGYYNKDSAITGKLSDDERVAVTQIALWNYLYDKKASDSSDFEEKFIGYFGDKEADVKKINSEFYLVGSATQTELYNNYIAKLVEGAKTAKESDTTPSLSVSTEDNDISLTEDKKYYQSSAIVTSSANTKTFKVKVNDSSPEGTVIVDENGEAIKEDTEYAVGKKLYLRVPVDSVDDEGATAKLSFLAVGYKYVGKIYASEANPNAQRVIGVSIENQEVEKPLEIKFDYTPEVPDTGMNTSQVIYFIGLVILVCGVGIVYANVKPKESN